MSRRVRNAIALIILCLIGASYALRSKKGTPVQEDNTPVVQANEETPIRDAFRARPSRPRHVALKLANDDKDALRDAPGFQPPPPQGPPPPNFGTSEADIHSLPRGGGGDDTPPITPQVTTLSVSESTE